MGVQAGKGKQRSAWEIEHIKRRMAPVHTAHEPISQYPIPTRPIPATFQAEKHTEMSASMQAAAAASSQALTVASETEQQLKILRPSFDDANNSWNASMDSALRAFEGTTTGQINELAEALTELTGQMQGLEASTKAQLSALDTQLHGLVDQRGAAAPSAGSAAGRALAASDDAEPALSPSLVISSLQALGSSIEELGRQVTVLQAAAHQPNGASPSPSFSMLPVAPVPLPGGSVVGAAGESSPSTEQAERRGLGPDAALTDSLALRLVALEAQSERRDLAALPDNLALRLGALEAQGDKFQRFIVEVVKRTTELAAASQEHERLIAGLSAGGSSERSQGGGTAVPAVAAVPSTASPRSSDRSTRSSLDRSHRGGIVLGRREPGDNGWGDDKQPTPSESGVNGLVDGKQAGGTVAGSAAASNDQLTEFEFKITQTLTTMHQMHLRKVLEWEEQLGAIQGQIQQLSGEQHQIQHQIQQLGEDQQQIWLHISSGAPASRQIVLVHTDKAAEARMSPIVEE